MEILRAQPDLGGKLAAGIDVLTDDEREIFNEFNEAYKAKFDFSFIIAARDNRKASILAAFKILMDNDRDTELKTASAQVERIAYLRLKDILL